MNWTENHIRNIVQNLAEENMLACRALFEVSEIIFTDKVPTMAVSIARHPQLFINLQFCNRHLETEKDVCCVLLHEFLHVILGHTEKYDYSDPMLNLALDAVINAIIHRSFGTEYSGFFMRFYPWNERSPEVLLRPAGKNSFKSPDNELKNVWKDVQKGKICADDLVELLNFLRSKGNWPGGGGTVLLGNHEQRQTPSAESAEILDGILKKMDGTKIWSKSQEAGTGDLRATETKRIAQYRINEWKKTTRRMILQCLEPDRRDRNQRRSSLQRLPQLTPGDVRALARFQFTGLIPLSGHELTVRTEAERVRIYLDVSGSMDRELELLPALLWEFRSLIRMPLQVFSDTVAEARFRNGQLVLHSSGGTCMSSVFDHLRENKVRKALVITDGYVEAITPQMLRGLNAGNIRFLISADGNPDTIMKAGLSYQQLKQITA